MWKRFRLVGVIASSICTTFMKQKSEEGALKPSRYHIPDNDKVSLGETETSPIGQ